MSRPPLATNPPTQPTHTFTRTRTSASLLVEEAGMQQAAWIASIVVATTPTRSCHPAQFAEIDHSISIQAIAHHGCANQENKNPSTSSQFSPPYIFLPGFFARYDPNIPVPKRFDADQSAIMLKKSSVDPLQQWFSPHRRRRAAAPPGPSRS